VRRLSGQAARICGTVLHRLAHLALGAVIALAVLLGAAAWRLSQGPVNLSWFTARLEAAANANGGPVRLSIGHTALAWEGFRLGVDRPIDLRLTDVRLTSAGGGQNVDLPRAEVSLSLVALLLGRVRPRAVELDGARLTLRRAADGTLSLDLGPPPTASNTSAANSAGSPLPALLAVLARPPTTDRTSSRNWLGQIRRVRIHDATLAMIDNGLGVTWKAPRVDIDLHRQVQGGVDGTFDLTLGVGNTQARLSGTATLSASATATQVTAQLTPVTPAALAQRIPALARLAVLDAPIGTQATLQFGPDLRLRQMHVTLRANPGTLKIGASQVPMLGATLVISGTPSDLSLDSGRLALRGRNGSPISTLTASGTLRHADGRFDATFALGVDQVDFADLPILWPEGIGGRGARAWVTQNITRGVAHDGHVEIAVTCRDDLSGVTLTGASGTLDGSDLDVTWLRPVPPLTHAQAQLRIVDPDTLDIAVQSAQQVVGNHDGDLTVTGGSMRITGLLRRDQTGAIRADVAGNLSDVIALLRNKRLHLLSDHPIVLNDPTGNATASLTVRVPLDANVRMDDIAIRATAHLTDAHLGGVIAGRDLDGGTLDLAADNDGLTIKGNAQLAGIQSALVATMDFRAGPPTQTLQRITLTGHPTAAQLARAGLDATEVLAGPMDLRAVLTEHRDGSGDVRLTAGLTGTVFSVAPLGWRKPAGIAAEATADLQLTNDRLVGIDAVTLDGDGVALRGHMEREGSRGTLVHLDRLVLGHTEMAGTVRIPASPSAGPIVIDVSGPQLDLSARLARHGSKTPPPKTAAPPGPPWMLDAHFGRALMAHGYMVQPLTVTAMNDGAVFTRLRLAGRTGDKGPFALRIGLQHGVRRLTANAANAGDLLRALDVIDTMQGGTLSITGTYDDANPDHALTGTAEISDFRMHQAAALGRLLQAMTLYGLVDVLRGPGLAFARLVAPFRLTDGMLELTDARAFSPSLGLTVKGRIDLNGGEADLHGTIVPAYFFNSLLGKVPLVGRLFSPERGGGVFAASYSIRGPLGDPAVSVNPLAALTPGFLRGVFGIF
jgi:hypothetical protein